MASDKVMTVGQVLNAPARLRPGALGICDLVRSLSYADWKSRARRLANGLSGLGLEKG